MRLVKTYDLEKTKTFDLSTLKTDLPLGHYVVKSVAVAKNGAESNESAGYSYSTYPTIWVKFKFRDTSYNPLAHQLAVGTASTRQDEYGINDRKKHYAAEWIQLDASQNIWLWGVTSGTNLSRAFGYGDYSGLGSSLIIDENFWATMPEELKIEEGQNIYTEAEDWKNHGYGIPTFENIEYTGKVEILDWDLTEASQLNGFIGCNLWYDIPLYGTLPALRTKATEITYGFDRLFHITEFPEIELYASNTEVKLINGLYTMTSLTELPNIIAATTMDLDNAFRGCVNVSKSSIEDTYSQIEDYITTYGSMRHDNAFKHCGLNADPTALDNIPSSWGGNR